MTQPAFLRFLRMPILLASPIALLASAPASGCKCVEQPPPLAATAEATAVFSGVVESVSRDGADYVVKLRVSGSWKGVTASELEVRTEVDPDACGFEFDVGAAYLVYAYPGIGARSAAMTTTSCTRSARMEDAGGDLAALGPMTPAPSKSAD